MEIKPGVTRIGFIGTGIMGKSMCGHLMDAGYSMTVFNRSVEKTESLVAKGARLAASPLEVAENSDVVFSIVGMPHDVREVILGEKGALKGLKSGSFLVDMTTSEPGLALEIYEAAKAKGVAAVDAPVSGGDIGAKEARLAIMAGGEEDTFKSLMPLFELMGKNIRHMGPAGAGQHTKVVNQILIATTMVGVCEGLIYAHKAGLDPMNVISVVGAGAAGSFSVNVLGPKIAAGNFEPGFLVMHFVKDLYIALQEARRMKLSLPGLALAEQLYQALEAQGYGTKGTQALYLALESINGIKRN